MLFPRQILSDAAATLFHVNQNSMGMADGESKGIDSRNTDCHGGSGGWDPTVMSDKLISFNEASSLREGNCLPFSSRRKKVL